MVDPSRKHSDYAVCYKYICNLVYSKCRKENLENFGLSKKFLAHICPLPSVSYSLFWDVFALISISTGCDSLKLNFII